jgi:hypothetical protein
VRSRILELHRRTKTSKKEESSQRWQSMQQQKRRKETTAPHNLDAEGDLSISIQIRRSSVTQ